MAAVVVEIHERRPHPKREAEGLDGTDKPAGAATGVSHDNRPSRRQCSQPHPVPGDAVDGPAGDMVVWPEPRFTFPRALALLLRDVAACGRACSRQMQATELFPKTTAVLEGGGEISSIGADGRCARRGEEARPQWV